MQLNIKELKSILSKVDIAIEKSKINPKSSWVELLAEGSQLSIKVTNTSYSLEATMPIENITNDLVNVTLLAETFIPLISKIECDTIEISEKFNTLIVETSNGSYSFPIIKELGKTKHLDTISFTQNTAPITLNTSDLNKVAETHTKGLVDSVFAKDIQQFIYVDNEGAITFTENIYVTKFDTNYSPFRILLTAVQSRLLGVLSGSNQVTLSLEQKPNNGTFTSKVCFSTDVLKLVLITQTQEMVDKFPSIRLRALSDITSSSIIKLDKKQLDKALARLLVFDKKFDITVMDYSKLVFSEQGVELVSIKSKNSEKLEYIESSNALPHEAIIRFADLAKQLKAITTSHIEISYGNRPAIVVHSGSTKQILPEIVRGAGRV